MTVLVLVVSALWAILVVRSLLRLRCPTRARWRRLEVPHFLTTRRGLLIAFILCAILLGVR
ncbi:MAG: hypothetical protein ACC652_06690, partial [Acidimicrobiales bacterium]